MESLWSLPSFRALTAALLVSTNEAIAMLPHPNVSGFIACLACSWSTARTHRRLKAITLQAIAVERRCSMPIKQSLGALSSPETDRNSSRSHSSNLEGGLPVGKLYTGIVWVVVPKIASMDVFAVIETGNNVQLRRIGKLYRSHWSAAMGGEAHDELAGHCCHGVHVLLFLWAHLLAWHAPVKWTDALATALCRVND